MSIRNHNLFERIREGITVARYGFFIEYIMEKTGISRRTYYRIVQAEQERPNFEVLQAIATWFGVTIDQILDPNVNLIDKGVINSKTAQASSVEELARLSGLEKAA